MPGMERNLNITIRNDISELTRVNQLFNDFYASLQLPAKVTNSLDIAIDEILSNIIKYGYDDQRTHEIVIRMSIKDQELTLEIEDDARPFNPLTVAEADTKSSIDERRIGGLGLHLVRSMMDDVSYRYTNERNCLAMRKTIKEI